MKKRLVLDMDEVLSDFVGGACKVFGVDLAELEAVWPEGAWDIVPPLGQLLGIPLSHGDFWRRVNCLEFWLNLDPLPWMQDILSLADRIDPDFLIATSPSRCTSSYDGKVRWLRRYLGSHFNRFAIMPHKHLLAQPGVLLIDDREQTVERFRQHGGEAILFPCHHNSNHPYKADPIAYLEEQLCI